MTLVLCSAAIDGSCPYREGCYHGEKPHERLETWCDSQLCSTFKVQRPSDGRWIRQRVQCEEVDDGRGLIGVQR